MTLTTIRNYTTSGDLTEQETAGAVAKHRVCARSASCRQPVTRAANASRRMYL